MALRPFRPQIDEKRLSLLQRRLRSTVWADQPANEEWRYGFSGGYLRQLVSYWLEEYDWRKQETAIGHRSHLRGDVDGVTVHVLVEPGSGPAPCPIILTHGWPWTFWDFAAMIDPLAHPERFGGDPEDAFDVVIPSLPGSIFSSPSPPGIGWRQTAGLWIRVMAELGYERFGAHGGDSGAYVTAQLAHEFSDHLIGAHLTFPALLGADLGAAGDEGGPGGAAPDSRHPSGPELLTHFLTHTLEPQTLAWAMQDSPAGLAAWMLHRRRAWSDCEGDLERRFSRDELITSVALYWLTGTVASSLRFYADSFATPWRPSHGRHPTLQAPTGIAVFPYELRRVPRSLAEEHANLVHWSCFDRGGHFAPVEEPELLVADLRTFFRPLRGV